MVVCLALGFCQQSLAQQTQVWVKGLKKPVSMVQDPTHKSRFYVVEQVGRIRVIEDNKLLDKPAFVADKSNFTSKNWEQGLLGMALDPNFSENHFVYLNYTGTGGTTHVSRFTITTPYEIENDSEQVLLTVDQPYGNHDGGHLEIGPDGMLYIGLGDGGAANDPHSHGQNTNTLLATILRIDISSTPDQGLAYAIPEDNPFAGQQGKRGEIWAYGLRNPWKFNFDSRGRMWIGDVGQNRFEEIDLIEADSKGGQNFGWNIMEAKERFKLSKFEGKVPANLVEPVWAYRQSRMTGGGSVTGGYFYEGSKIPSLENRYIFADFMMGSIWSFKLKNGKADDVVEHTRELGAGFGDSGTQLAISSFARDQEGELYILDHKTGRVLKIVP